jgi:Bacterial self-protective colicin-like immunity
MSEKLLRFAKKIIDSEISADKFVNKFMDKWREERDSGIFSKDNPQLSEKLSSIFCLADLYNPEEDREEYEYDEYKLRLEIKKIYSSSNLSVES